MSPWRPCDLASDGVGLAGDGTRCLLSVAVCRARSDAITGTRRSTDDDVRRTTESFDDVVVMR